MPQKSLDLRRDGKNWEGKGSKPAILPSLIFLKSVKEFPNNIAQWYFISQFNKSLGKDQAGMLLLENAFVLKGESSEE